MRLALPLAAAVAFLAIAELAIASNTSAIRAPTGIPAEPLGVALRALAKERGFQLAYDSEQVDRRRTRGASGDLTIDQALTRLLRGTGLTYYRVSDNAVVIEPITNKVDPTPYSAAQKPESTEEAQRSSSHSFRMAQVDQGPPPGSAEVNSANQQRQGQRDENQLAEVIVTAQKLRQRALDVPISLVVVGSEELQRRQITSVDDLQFAVPGMSVQDAGNFERFIEIRGISNVSGNGAQVGEYVDEADITPQDPYSELDLALFDLQRVEVLRGPQGTLYGDGSMGGTVHYITNDPRLNEFEMSSDVQALFTQYGAPSQRLVAVINSPLMENAFALRFAGDFDHEGGWIDQPAVNLKNFNSNDTVDARLKALWRATPQLSVNAMEVIHRLNGHPSTGEDVNSNFTQAFNQTTTPAYQSEFDLSNLTVKYDLRRAQLLNTATYFWHDDDRINNGEAYYYNGLPPAPPSDEYYSLSSRIPSKDLNDELRLASTGLGSWKWVVGGFYRRFTEFLDYPDNNYFAVPLPPGSPLPTPYSYQVHNWSKSRAAFGDTSYEWFGRLTLGMGVRYFKDDEATLYLANNQASAFHSTSPRVYVQYKLTGTANIYASAAKGFRSGGFNYGEPPFGPESVWTYELGSKMQLLQGKLEADADVFDSDYTGYVIYGYQPPSPFGFASNAGDARIKGIEGSLACHPSERWKLSLNGDYLNARFVSIDVSDTYYVVGDPLPYVPRYEVTASAERDFDWNDRPGFARIDYSQRARESYRYRSISPLAYGQSDYIYMLDFHAGLQWNANLQMGLFVQNLLNDRGYIGAEVLESAAPRARPRTFGIDLSVKLD